MNLASIGLSRCIPSNTSHPANAVMQTLLTVHEVDVPEAWGLEKGVGVVVDD